MDELQTPEPAKKTFSKKAFWLIVVLIFLATAALAFKKFYKQSPSPASTQSPISQKAKDPKSALCDETNTATSLASTEAKETCALNLYGKNLSDFAGTDLGALENLKQLNLSNNQLAQIPGEVGNLKNLEMLDVSKNKLIFLPSSLSNLSKLTYLNLSNNQIKNLPESFSNLNGLKQLNLSQNPFTELPAAVLAMNGLVELNLAQTQISQLPKELASFPNLFYITTTGSKITNAGIADFKKLRAANLPEIKFITK